MLSSYTDAACFIAASIFVFSFSVDELLKFTLTYSSVGATTVTALPPNRETAVLSLPALCDWAELIKSDIFSLCPETLSETSTKNNVVSSLALSTTDIPERERIRAATVRVLSTVLV